MVCLAQTVHLSYTDTNTSLNRLKRDSTRRTSPRRSIGCVQQWFLSIRYVRFKPCTYLASKLALSPNGPKQASTCASLPRSPIGCIHNDFWAYGTFSQPMHLSCTDTNTVSERTEMRLHMTHVTKVFYQVCQKWFSSLCYVWGKPCTYLASKMISKTMVRLAQTMHQSCKNSNTVSKRTKMRFHMTHVTSVFYPVCPKLFSNLWYVRHKPCTYLASRLSLSPNRLK
jgi:hypothetical protein